MWILGTKNTEWRIAAWTCEIAKRCSPSRSRYCLDTCSKNKLQVNILGVYTNFKKLSGYVKIENGGGGATRCLRIRYRTRMVRGMCDINKDFDKHCLLSQKRLIHGNINMILYKFDNYWYIYDLYISDGITMHCSDSDWTIIPI